jgi:hypothetical protein
LSPRQWNKADDHPRRFAAAYQVDLCVTGTHVSELLYDLSNWADWHGWTWSPRTKEVVYRYTLGYLIRKVPFRLQINKLYDGMYLAFVVGGPHVSAESDTPEDALAWVAIKLFRQGLLMRGLEDESHDCTVIVKAAEC